MLSSILFARVSLFVFSAALYIGVLCVRAHVRQCPTHCLFTRLNGATGVRGTEAAKEPNIVDVAGKVVCLVFCKQQRQGARLCIIHGAFRIRPQRIWILRYVFAYTLT